MLGKVAAAMALLWFFPAPASAGDGWGYLIDKLVADGLEAGAVEAVFADERMASFDGLEFSPDRPRETRNRYRPFLGRSSIAQARRCRTRYAEALVAAEERTGVAAGVLTAILHIESHCGMNTGGHRIFHRLARLAMANEPANFARNRLRFARKDGRVDADVDERLRARGRYLEDTFYPEVRAAFPVAARLGVDPLDLRGSHSGAFGYPQFLPTSYLRFGADGDGDGRVNLHQFDDAALSAARYLAGHGWRPGLTAAEQEQIVWTYNRSSAYVETVLALAVQIDPRLASKRRSAGRKR